MRKILSLVTCFAASQVFAASPAKIEICKSHIEKNGEKLYLSHSIFEAGDDPLETKTLFNYESDFKNPVTYTFDFSTRPEGKLYLGCAYNGGHETVIERVEVKFKPKKCVEKMYPDQANRVQTFQCER